VLEQSANIKFCFKTGKTATETFQLIKQAYGDNALSRTGVSEWYTRFRDGRENPEDDECSGRPTAVRTPDTIEAVRELISTDRRMTLRMMEEEVLFRFVKKNSSSTTSVLGNMKLVSFAWQSETSHCSINKAALAKQWIPELNHSPYSPVLSPPNFVRTLISRSRISLKTWIFVGVFNAVFVFVLCGWRPCGKSSPCPRDPNECLNYSYFKKSHLNWNKP
jgi:hypothetical protein